MTEIINQIKAKIEQFNGESVVFKKEEVLDIITTIESLRSELETETKDRRDCERATKMWKKYSEDQELLVIKREKAIESQKEEIEKKNAWLKNTAAKEANYDNLRKQFDLAVKGLKYYSKMKFRCEPKFCDGGVTAKSTLSEIERLQNAQT